MKAMYFDGMPPSWNEQPEKRLEEIEDSLDFMLDSQRGLMLECEADNIPDDVLLYISLMNIAGEAHEAAEFFGDITKPWKKGLDFAKLRESTEEEAIDILHFLLQVFVILGMNAKDIFSLYNQKNRTNSRRIAKKKEEAKHV